ncbi:hypothetical protein DY000_02058861 [Brassica cretica]|uniref:Uncharacterized protein n=1 Tax=Brassica cretica TaxID=69181 RepID=A0ABQ7B305_BRACR|nr:hypothetical protein DY000_02058861 [Brassica cretica]
MQVMRVSALEDNQTGETFSQRAEWFYQRRPLLLSLCQDLFDVESILSFEQTQITACDKQKVDELVSQLVTANLERDMAQNELLRGEKKFREASKMIELLKKLVM